MTIDTVLTLGRLKELHALTRVRRAITSNASDPDWSYAVAVMDARLYELRDLLAREDPQLIRDCEELLDTAQQEMGGASVPFSADVPPGRIH